MRQTVESAYLRSLVTMSQEQTSDVEVPIRRTTGETLSERLTDNAYFNILPARYLMKDENGDVIEEPEELFKRVGRNVAIAEAVHTDEDVTITPEEIKPDHPRRDELLSEIWDSTSFRIEGDIVEGKTDDGWVEASEAADPVPISETNAKWVDYHRLIDRLDAEGWYETVDRVETWAMEFIELMENLSWMPNSPTIMNAGDELQQLSACFVNSPQDSIGDIHETAKEAALIFQSGGGVGYTFSTLRPYGDPVGSTGGIASGPITFMRTFDQLCETIAQGGKRRGAQMGIMRISHPDIIQFIHAKNKDVSLAHTLRLNDPDDFTHNSFAEALEEAREMIDEDGRVPEHLRNAVEGHLSNFNISVAVTDEFMDAVENGEEYTFKNPQTGKAHVATEETEELYSMFGLGEYVEPGEVLSVPAQEIWTRMIEGAHENGEPGVVYIDRINDLHSFPTESTAHQERGKHEILATNPCGEQPLEENEPCNLGHINLSTIIREDRKMWEDYVIGDWGESYDSLEAAVDDFLDQAINWEMLYRRIEAGTRFLDNVVTMSNFPTEAIQEQARKNRKIGLGIMGLAQMYVQLGVEYGDEIANEVARQLMLYINHESKAVSRRLTETRGKFENWDESKYADPTEYASWFEQHVGEDPAEWEDGFPIRNHNTTTIAPTGTTSMLGNTSGGCEPIYSVVRFKNVSDDVQGDEKLVEFDDYFFQVLEENGIDVEAVKEEAVEQLKNNEWTGIAGLETVPDRMDDLFVTTEELSAREHASVQCALQEGVDSAISKTTNAPHDQTLEDAKETFEYIYKNGGKGVTYYRQGTRSKQVLTTNDKEWEDDPDEIVADYLSDQFDIEGDDPEAMLEELIGDPSTDVDSDIAFAEKQPRPDVLHGVTQRIDTGYGRLYVNINEDSERERPFELFANIGNSGGFTASFTEALAKTISISLRSGVDPEELTNELQGIRSPKVAWDEGEQIQSIPDAIGTAMRRYLDGDIERAYPQQKTLDESAERSDSTADGKSESEVAGTPETDGGTMADSESTATDSAQQSVLEAGENPECPECSSLSLQYSEGCKKCGSCGWSEC